MILGHIVATLILCAFNFTEAEVVGNTLQLSRFYFNVANVVKVAGNKMLADHLAYNYSTERQNWLKQKMVDGIKTISNIPFDMSDPPTNYRLCKKFDAFKQARKVLEYYNELQPVSMKGPHRCDPTYKFDKIYNIITNECPKLKVYEGYTDYLSLLLTKENEGFGQFMGRSNDPDWNCCQFSDTINSQVYKLKFRFEKDFDIHKTIRYGDTIAIWTESKFLKNRGLKLSWNEWEWNGKMRWTVDTACSGQDNYQEIYQCDLISFRTHHPSQAEFNHYLTESDTSEMKSGGTFAILRPDGKIPEVD